MADQLLHGPAVQRLAVRLEGDQVVRQQPLQAIGQAARESPTATAYDHHIEQLLLHRQVRFDFDREGRTAEEVDQQQAEQAVPVTQCFPFAGHRTPLRVGDRLYRSGSRLAALGNP